MARPTMRSLSESVVRAARNNQRRTRSVRKLRVDFLTNTWIYVYVEVCQEIPSSQVNPAPPESCSHGVAIGSA